MSILVCEPTFSHTYSISFFIIFIKRQTAMKKHCTYLLFTLSFVLSMHVKGQDGANDPTFDVTSGSNGFGNEVIATAIQTDGKILVAGAFDTYNGMAAKKVARLNTDGSLDATFTIGSGPNSNEISGLAIQSDGKIFVGGSFSTCNGIAVNSLARLNANGSLDPSFTAAFTAMVGVVQPTVQKILIQSDGKILIYGYFPFLNVADNFTLLRLNTNGSLDASFSFANAGIEEIAAVALQKDEKIIVSFLNKNSSTKMVRLNTNGSVDASFIVGTWVNGVVGAIKLQSDGKILIGGKFTTASGTSNIARLNTNGTQDPFFNNNFGTGTAGNIETGFDGSVSSISIESNGKIIIGGIFASFNGMARNTLARLNADGSLDQSFVVGAGVSDNPAIGYITTTDIQKDGKIIIGGEFISYNGTPANYFARLNTNGSIDTGFNLLSGANNAVYTSAIQTDGKIIIGGWFTSYNGTGSTNVVRLNADGSRDGGFNVGTGASDFVYTTTLQSNGKIIIGGYFTNYNGKAINHVARLNTNGSLDETFNVGTGANSTVLTSAIQKDGKIIIGGVFTYYDKIAANRIVRLNADGTRDISFKTGTGANNHIFATVLQSDGKIIIGGTFTEYNGISRNNIARLNTDGSLDETFNPGTGTNNYVYTVSVQKNGQMIIGGYFSTYNGVSINNIARLNTNGSLDGSFNVGLGANNAVWTSAIETDGRIIIGGGFTSYNGTSSNRITRLNTDGSLDTLFNTNTGTAANNYVWTTGFQNGGKIIIGGAFTNYNGTARNRIARLINMQ
jgi:uncharacterized delta-60 repeat protein